MAEARTTKNAARRTDLVRAIGDSSGSDFGSADVVDYLLECTAQSQPPGLRLAALESLAKLRSRIADTEGDAEQRLGEIMSSLDEKPQFRSAALRAFTGSAGPDFPNPRAGVLSRALERVSGLPATDGHAKVLRGQLLTAFRAALKATDWAGLQALGELKDPEFTLAARQEMARIEGLDILLGPEDALYLERWRKREIERVREDRKRLMEAMKDRHIREREEAEKPLYRAEAALISAGTVRKFAVMQLVRFGHLDRRAAGLEMGVEQGRALRDLVEGMVVRVEGPEVGFKPGEGLVEMGPGEAFEVNVGGLLAGLIDMANARAAAHARGLRAEQARIVEGLRKLSQEGTKVVAADLRNRMRRHNDESIERSFGIP